MSATVQSDPIEAVAHLIEGVPIAVLTSCDEHGSMHSRPVATQNLLFDGELWFFNTRGSRLVANLQVHPQVNLGYAHGGRHTYVSITGRAAVIDDLQQVRMLWRLIYPTRFPHGAEDPDLALVRITITHANSWEPSGHSLIHPDGLIPEWMPVDDALGIDEDRLTI